MRIVGRPSWRFDHDTGEQSLHFALYVRRAVGLPVDDDPATPPPLIADVPAHDDLVAPADRDAVRLRWTGWFQDLAEWAGAWHLTVRPTAAEQRDWLRTIEAARGEACRPAGLAARAGCGASAARRPAGLGDPGGLSAAAGHGPGTVGRVPAVACTRE